VLTVLWLKLHYALCIGVKFTLLCVMCTSGLIMHRCVDNLKTGICAGAAMIPVSWCEMQCPVTFAKEERKVAKAHPRFCVVQSQT